VRHRFCGALGRFRRWSCFKTSALIGLPSKRYDSGKVGNTESTCAFWSDSKSCKVDLENVTTTRYEAIHRQDIDGVVRYRVMTLSGDMKFRGGGSCTVIFSGVLCGKVRALNFCSALTISSR
jgi:hypothetical protein